MKKIAICIPTFMEEDAISQTTSLVDKSLKKYFNQFDCFIVNADNSSQDKTKDNFLNTQTDNKKIYLSSELKGKGSNLFNFFKFCQKESVDFAATFDADLFSMNECWVYRLLKPIIENSADYILPLYKRKRFEGSTTNNFAFPLIYTFFGETVRQPIGGEFAFNKKLIDYFLTQKTNKETFKYGIDIFMTIHAIGGGFRFKEIYLGEKIHKPSFTKIQYMPYEVFSSAFLALSYYKPNTDNTVIKHLVTNITRDRKFDHKIQAIELKAKMIDVLKKNKGSYHNIANGQFIDSYESILIKETISFEEWAQILSLFISQNRKIEPEKLAELLLALSLIRTVTFWLQAEKISAEENEKIILLQAKSIRKEYLKLITS